jgi:hypothetical protein
MKLFMFFKTNLSPGFSFEFLNFKEARLHHVESQRLGDEAVVPFGMFSSHAS